ncbi:hypothetical protein psal_cds_1182 [Pandoravirus salinus]|uniref:Uncharacterized protein n=1 Tax=Pandoravirus salinus TaxID=1349410 RepID=S4VYP9_9VIRU|nr:hypothetical protein psal_cds_1182 [Pandoravirus salinus]AGO85463.1 hypothetical protein psal_cds_1182 [Pandoravirus salinus]
MDKPRARAAISDDDYAAVLGKVFVYTTSYAASAYQVVGRTKCYVRAISVPLVSTHVALYGDGAHKIDWTKVVQPAPGSNSKKGSLYSLVRHNNGDDGDVDGDASDEPTYCLVKASDDFYAFPVETGSDHAFTTVGY